MEFRPLLVPRLRCLFMSVEAQQRSPPVHARTHARTGARDVSDSSRKTSVDGVDGVAVVVERRRLNDDAERADQRDGREHPEHEPIKNHRHELPVLLHLLTSPNDKQDNR